MTTHGAFKEGAAVWVRTFGRLRRGTVVRDDGGPNVRVDIVGQRGQRVTGVARANLTARRTPDDHNVSHVPDRVVGGTGERPAMRSVPKGEKYDWPWYVKRVAAMPCAWCGREGRSNAHHWPTRGAGGGDDGVIPLCVSGPYGEGCHDRYHRTLTIGHMLAHETREWQLRQQRDLLADVVAELLEQRRTANG